MQLENKRVLVTGCAGFIGSHLVDELLDRGNQVLGIDNMSAGKEEFLEDALTHRRFSLVELDLLEDELEEWFRDVEVVCHFAANPDVRVGASDTRVHFDQNIEVTYRVLDASRREGVEALLFPSTSTVYGEPDEIPTPEDYGPLTPISIYGASKLACEGLVSSFCHTFDFDSVIYRFANVVGPRSTHNVIHDFVRKLKEDPHNLEILGAAPGTCKSYVHVKDCIRAMIAAAEGSTERVDVFNIGSIDKTYVKEIADIVVDEMGLDEVYYRWTGGVDGGRGWKGDVKVMLLSTEKLRRLGWGPELSSSEAVRKAARAVLNEN